MIVNNGAFGSVEIVATAVNALEKQFTLCGGETMAYAKIAVPPRCPKVGLKFRLLNVGKDVSAFIVWDGAGQEPEPIQAGEWKTLFVDVAWKKGRCHEYPSTRRPGNDNWDIVFIKSDGQFVDVECSLFTRGGNFYLGWQRVYQGAFVRTRNGGSTPEALECVPTRAVHAYPGSNFRDVWRGLAEKVLARAAGAGTNMRKSDAFVPTWQPPVLPDPAKVPAGWLAGTVRYFNLLTGTGEVEDCEGVKHFVHFKNILPPEGSDKTPEVAVLTPMTTVLFQVGEATGHARPGIDAAKSVKPFMPKEPAD